MLDVYKLRKTLNTCVDGDMGCYDNCPYYTVYEDVPCITKLLVDSRSYVTNEKTCKGIDCCLKWRIEPLDWDVQKELCKECPYSHSLNNCIDALLEDILAELDKQ